MDEFTQEGVAIAVAEATSAEWVISVLTQLVASHGGPAYLRSDNGSEFVALAVQAWLARRQVRTLYIDPGCPDYHLIENRSIHQALAFLLDHQPPTLHFVLAGRATPPLPLARYRARQELLELRALEQGPGDHSGSRELGQLPAAADRLGLHWSVRFGWPKRELALLD